MLVTVVISLSLGNSQQNAEPLQLAELMPVQSVSRGRGRGWSDLVCLCVYVDTVLVPMQPPSCEPRCFPKFLAPNGSADTDMNPTSNSFHS